MFSGIGAPETAMPGWQWLWHAEIEPFPSAVMAARHPGSINLGDVSAPDFAERALNVGRPDVIVFGSPCQSFSVAGKRLGLDDPRGNLALVALAVVAQVRPRWLVFENVPGLLSSGGGDDFAAFLSVMGQCGYLGCWRVLDARHFGVPQRRRRVFFVGHLGDWRPAAAVLFEPASLRGDTAPSQEAREGVAARPGVRAAVSSGHGWWDESDIGATLRADATPTKADTLIASTGDIAHYLNAGGMGRQDYETETRVTHTLRGDGFDASEDGTGRGTPLVPVAFDTTQITSAANYSNPKPGDPCHPLAAVAHPPAIAFHPTQDPISSTDGTTHCLGTGSRQGTATVAVALQDVSGKDKRQNGAGWNDSGTAYTVDTLGTQGVAITSAVRRLSPTECARLQGFPDDHCAIVYRGKPAADGPQYKALGNSMAVPVVRWILSRLERCA